MAKKPHIHVLIVEDDTVDRMACRRALQKNPVYEFTIWEAETGREGLQLAHAHKPDCILLDYGLPDLDGLEFLSELRNDLGEIPIPVMMLTGADNALVAVEAMKRGARDYVVKDVERQYLELLPAVIERVLREQQLVFDKNQAEAKYRTLVEQIPAIAYIAPLDKPASPSYISPQIKVLGFSREEWLADPEMHNRQIHPDDRVRVLEELARSSAGGKPLRCEYRLLAFTGRPLWFRNEACVVHDETGKPLFFQGILVEMTASKQAEEELRAHRHRLEELVERRTAMLETANEHLRQEIGERERAREALQKYADEVRDLYNRAPCGYHSLDRDGVFVQINDTELGWLGCRRDEVIGRKKFADFLTPRSLKKFARAFARFREEGKIPDAEFELVRGSGGAIPVLLSATAARDAGGNYVMSRATLFDLTERKRADAAQFDKREFAEVTLASIGDAVITTDAAGSIEYMNPVAEQLTGWRLAQARRKPLAEVFRVIDETTRQDAENPVERCLHEGQKVEMGNRNLLVRADGGEVAVSDSAAPIRSHEDKVIGAVIVFHDVTQERRLTQQLSYQATHDALTGLVNRQEFERRLARVLERAVADNTEHALCYIDLDQFKIVNDASGHAAGDQLLRQISALLQENVRQRDTLARLGGDEFGLLLELCPLDQAWRIAEETLRAVQNFRFAWEGQNYAVGASIGIVAVTAVSENISSVLGAADSACYTAKQHGRNRIHIYQTDEAELKQRRHAMQWVTRLNHALDENGFRLFFQPIIRLAANGARQAHYEILLRMPDKDGKLIPPGAFLPAAERYNLLPAIDRWVIGNVVARVAAARSGFKINDTIFFINLSAAAVADASILDFFRDQLKQHEVPAHLFGFEITETALLANTTKAEALVRELKRLGCWVTLDNFGGSISAIFCLKNLPVDFLKITGTFIKEIVSNPIACALVEVINRVAHIMVIQTVGQSAETQPVMEKLKDLGVDHAQGYAISSPRPLEELPQRELSADFFF